ncbi:MAG: hypothetical protein K6A43_12710 [Treponema sp.]|nr:hypothetical protein [Treponema sp.]
MSDAAFYEMMAQIDDFSLIQKKSLLKALKKSLSPFAKIGTKKDRHLTESLIGIAGNSDYSISQIKEERLSSL